MTKFSVIVALCGAMVVTSVDVFVNQTIDATKEIALAFIAFAAIRQAVGMKTGK